MYFIDVLKKKIQWIRIKQNFVKIFRTFQEKFKKMLRSLGRNEKFKKIDKV